MKKPIEAVIEDVVIQPKKIQPIIVNFQNGHLKDEETENMKCGLYNDGKKNKTVLAMSNDQVVYKGYRPDLDKELTYTMLAIHNKKTGKVRLIQAERWDVVPVLDEPIDDPHDDNIDKTAALNKQFGSKKVKRRTEQYERMKIDVDNVKEQLEKTVSNIEIDKSDLEAVSKDDFIDGLHLPPCNRDATTASEVYSIDDFIPKEILEILSNVAPEIVESEMEENKKAAFYEKTFNQVKDNPLKIGILLYISGVMKWLNQPLKSFKKDTLICPYSPELSTHILDSYSVMGVNGRQRPNIVKDKAVMHSLILSLMLWNYTLDLELFSSILRVGFKKLHDLARYVGATTHKSDKKIIVLKIPLPPPISTVIKRKKRINN